MFKKYGHIKTRLDEYRTGFINMKWYDNKNSSLSNGYIGNVENWNLYFPENNYTTVTFK